MLKYLGIILLLVLALTLSIMLSSLPIVMAKVPQFVITNEVDDNDDDVGDSKNKLVVVSKINLQNISKTGII